MVLLSTLTYRDVPRVTFPVFQLPEDDFVYQDKLLWLGGKLLDDRNMPGDTLGKRRLQTYMEPLFNLNRSIIDLAGILKNKPYIFIDSKGLPFYYEKTRMLPLKYYRIDKVVGKETASLLYLRGVKAPLTVPRPPHHDMVWAGLLHVNKFPWMLYEYSEVNKPSTNRKV